MMDISTACGVGSNSSRHDWQSRRLWSLWDMLSLYGYEFILATQNLRGLAAYLKDATDADPGQKSPPFEPNNLISVQINIVWSLAKRLGMASVNSQCAHIQKLMWMRRPLIEILHEIPQLDRRLEEDAKSLHFLFVPIDRVKYAKGGDLFQLGTKFKVAQRDIESAGKCLAAGEGTACVLHLGRAMEVALRKLATRLNIEIGPRDNWGNILKKMNAPIDGMPQSTTPQKEKRQRWSEARTHLFHIKECWRDRPAHGKEFFSAARAQEIFEAVRVFMAHFARL
jgi:hypothetical protein